MEAVYKFLLGSHIFFGSISLIVFWLPAVFTKKGGEWHNKIGRIYVRLMWFVVISAGLMCLRNIFFVGNYNAAIFLGFLTLITAHPIWHGTAILKYKTEQPRSFVQMHMSFRAVIIIAAFGMIAYGVYLHFQGEVHPLLFIFGILGASDLPAWLKEIKNPIKNANWLTEHLSGMIISGIASYTAFFAFGGRAMLGKILTGYWQILPWVLPTIIGIIAIKYQKKKYEKKKTAVVLD